MKLKIGLMALMAVLLFGLSAGTSLAEGLEIERMSKEQLQDRLMAKDLVVVDVRTGRDWKSSEFKVKGAIRVDTDIVNWAKSYDKDTIFVLYCA